jgi:hypothetical protein
MGPVISVNIRQTTSRSRRSVRAASIAVIVAVSSVAAFGQSGIPTERRQSIADTESYAVYSVLVPMWVSPAEKEILFQQDTDPKPWCSSSRALPTAEWQAVEADFFKQNTTARTLMARFSLTVPYRFISRGQIEAHNAKLALKYPGVWQHRPGSLEYVALSAVGFNPAKTKAMVHVRTQGDGGTYMLELRDGRWVESAVGGCRWAA